jgi:hypothetical protein
MNFLRSMAIAGVVTVSILFWGWSLSMAEQPGFEQLKGKWVRSDGGYVLEIKSVGLDGKADIAYYNPSPIHVAITEASVDGEVIKVFVELRDVNYPGSNYNLAYDAKNDQLQGDYYQAVAKEHYQIFFERMK